MNHFGFQVAEITFHKERLEKEGFFARDEMNTTCCETPNGVEKDSCC